MVDLEFSRDAAGVKAKESWHDADTFAIIGSESTRMTPRGAFSDFPLGEKLDGVVTLREVFTSFRLDVSNVILEFSDACAVLGSGTESAVSNMDSTEIRSSSEFKNIESRLGGEGG